MPAPTVQPACPADATLIHLSRAGQDADAQTPLPTAKAEDARLPLPAAPEYQVLANALTRAALRDARAAGLVAAQQPEDAEDLQTARSRSIRVAKELTRQPEHVLRFHVLRDAKDAVHASAQQPEDAADLHFAQAVQNHLILAQVAVDALIQDARPAAVAAERVPAPLPGIAAVQQIVFQAVVVVVAAEAEVEEAAPDQAARLPVRHPNVEDAAVQQLPEGLV